MPVPLFQRVSSLRAALWHFRQGGLPQLRLWWSRQDSTRSLPKETVVRNAELARNGFPLPEMAAEPAYEARRDHVLYLLHNSLPHHSGGYATRTHGLLPELSRSGRSEERRGGRDPPRLPLRHAGHGRCS